MIKPAHRATGVFYGVIAVVSAAVFSATPPKTLTAQQISNNTLQFEQNYGTVDVSAKFIPVAHVMIEHGVTASVANLEPASGPTPSNGQQDIYVSFVGGSKGDAVVVSCEVEASGSDAKTCGDADVDGPSRQMVQAGDTLRSNLTVGPDVAEIMRDKDMTVVISFSYI